MTKQYIGNGYWALMFNNGEIIEFHEADINEIIEQFDNKNECYESILYDLTEIIDNGEQLFLLEDLKKVVEKIEQMNKS